MTDEQYGKLIRAWHARLVQRPRSVFLRRLLRAAQAKVRTLMEGV